MTARINSTWCTCIIGENIAVREVEELLFKHPDIADVHVFGVPDDRYGEELCAWVCLRSGNASEVTPDQLQAWAEERIARFKVPRYWQLKDPCDVPLTASGKPQKFKMRAKAAFDLGLDLTPPALVH
jgi:fatty-acyl-CoA synthase